jgi:hypothetical protein
LRHVIAVSVATSKSSPAVPDPDPQPLQPRPLPFWKWMLLLLPSVIATAYPLVDQIIRTLNIHIRIDGNPLDVLLPGLALAMLLSFVLGFLLEKWRWGTVPNGFRAFGFGCLILIVNTFISFAGCTAFTHVFTLG